MLAMRQWPSVFLHMATPRPRNLPRAESMVNSYSYHTESPIA